jgi:hypothetical protein
MKEEKIVGDKTTPYYNDEVVRSKIDKLLHQNSILESALGKDSTKKELIKTKVKQEKLFDKIKDLDLEYYKILIPESER